MKDGESKMTSYERQTVGDAVQAVAGAILRGCGEAMAAHCNDPEAISILAAGFVVAIRNADKDLLPGLRIMIHEMLAKP